MIRISAPGSGMRARLASCGTAAALMAVTAASYGQSTLPIVQFPFASEYDSGVQSHVAISRDNVVIEVHKAQASGHLWYHIGRIVEASTEWAPSDEYDSGQTPAVAINDANNIVEVHQSQGNSGLWYHIGKYVPPGAPGMAPQVEWGGSRQYDSGANPGVAIDNRNRIVEVHKSQSNSGLWFRTGVIRSNGTIGWSSDAASQYDSGVNPAVAINDSGAAIEVHRSQGNSGLWYHVGKWSNGLISWGPGVQYDQGGDPAISISATGLVLEVHESAVGGSLSCRTGRLSGGHIDWYSPARWYGAGAGPSVATTSDGLHAVETHQSQVALTLWASASLIGDRGSWMEDTLEGIKDRRLSEIVLPGSHDAGMYETTVPQLAARTQDADLYGQLQAGVRYFDLRPHWNGSELVIFHGPIVAESVQTVLNQVRQFMTEGHKELVILKFSHYDNFDSGTQDYGKLADMIVRTLAPWLYVKPSGSTRLADTTMGSFLTNGGRVLVVCDGSYPISTPHTGIYVYRDWDSSDPASGDLTVYDEYTDTIDTASMVVDQLIKYSLFTGRCKNDTSVPCDLFLMSWTVTPITDVWDVCQTANADLGQSLAALRVPNAAGKMPNVLYTDFGDHSSATDAALYLDDVAP